MLPAVLPLGVPAVLSTVRLGDATVVRSVGLHRAWVAAGAAGQVASPPPLARAALVTLGAAAAATATVRVIGAPRAGVATLPAGIAVVLTQVTTWPAAEQVQPAPVADT